MSDKNGIQSDNKTFISVVEGIPSEQHDSALGLFYKAFSRKLRFTLGSEERALHFLKRCIVPEQAICAIDSTGRLVGFAAIKSDGNGFINPTLTTFCAEYGIASGVMRALMMSFLDYKPANNEMMIESICVDESVRGMGIGQALLSHIKNLAHRQRKQHVILDVIAENSEARRLYERIGFCETGRKTFTFLGPVFGFRHVIRMQFSSGISAQVSSQK